MSILDGIASSQGRRDQLPNQALAKELAQSKAHQSIKELAENLWNKDRNIRSDCLKVVYEIGYFRRNGSRIMPLNLLSS